MLGRGEAAVILLLVRRRLFHQPIRAFFAVIAVAIAVCLGIALYLATALSDDQFIESAKVLGGFDAKIEVPGTELLTVVNLARTLRMQPSVVLETQGSVNGRAVTLRGIVTGDGSGGGTDTVFISRECFGSLSESVLVKTSKGEYQLKPKEHQKISDCGAFVDPALIDNAPSMVYLKCDDDGCEEALAKFASSSLVQKTGATLQSVGARRAARSLAAAFSANIYLLLLIAALIAAFSIWNSFEISVISARRDYQALRTIGLSSTAIYVSLLIEGALIGLLGAGLGILGLPLAERVYSAAREVLAIHYSAAFEGRDAVSGSLVVYGCAVVVAVASTMLGAHLPARRAASLAPAIIQRSAVVSIDNSGRQWLWVSGVSGLCVTAALLFQGELFMGEVLALGILGFGAGLIPSLITAVAGGIAQFKVYGTLAAGELRSSAGAVVRTTLFIYVAASLVVAMGTMVSSFRGTVDRWIQGAFSGELYVKAESGYLPAELVTSALKQVERTDTQILSLREQAFIYEDALISIHGQELDLAIQLNAIQLYEDSGKRQWSEVIGVSEPFTRKFKRGLGDTVTLLGRKFRIGFIAKDYSSDRGIVYLDSVVFRELFNHDRLLSLSFFNLGGEGETGVRKIVDSQATNVSINNSRELRSLVLGIFDRTFRITELVGFIAIALSVCGLIFTAFQLALERAPQVQLLRTLGVQPQGVFKILLLTYLAIISVAAALGGFVGALLGWVLAAVINPTYFGWTIDFRLSADALTKGPLLLLVLSIFVSWVSAIYEARGGGRVPGGLE